MDEDHALGRGICDGDRDGHDMTAAMTARRPRFPGTGVAVRAVLAVAIASGVFLLTADPMRRGEARLAAAVARWLGINRIGLAAEAAILVVPNRGPAFFGIVTRSCSATASVLCLGVLSVLVVPQRRKYRGRAVLAGACTVFLINELRLLLVLWAGSRLGPQRVAPLHDLLGTPMSLFGAALGVVTWWLTLERADHNHADHNRADHNPADNHRPEAASSADPISPPE